MPDFSIGVDLGGTNLRIAAVSIEGPLLEKITLGTQMTLGPDHLVDEMCGGIQRLITQYQRGGSFLGTGLGIPGAIDLDTGTIRKSANLPGWSGYPVRAAIERRLGGAPVFLDNDGNVAALGEKWLGAGRNVSSMAMITLGTGIGGGIVLDGKIWHGMNGLSGEFGHNAVELEGVPCGCGSHGCAERYASGSALVRMAREAIATGEAPNLEKASSDPEFGAKSIYDLAMQGDPAAKKIFHTFGRALGIMLAGVINTLNVEMYVIGGGVASAWDAFAPTMFKEVRERSIVYAATDPEEQSSDRSPRPTTQKQKKSIITRALLGSDAGLFGAARVPLMR